MKKPDIYFFNLLLGVLIKAKCYKLKVRLNSFLFWNQLCTDFTNNEDLKISCSIRQWVLKTSSCPYTESFHRNSKCDVFFCSGALLTAQATCRSFSTWHRCSETHTTMTYRADLLHSKNQIWPSVWICQHPALDSSRRAQYAQMKCRRGRGALMPGHSVVHGWAQPWGLGRWTWWIGDCQAEGRMAT